jgi:endonuclease-3 related protein
VEAAGGVPGLASWPTAALREALLGVHGIGPESADAILLYAFGRPVFVVDTYARRLFERLGSPEPRPSDRALKARSEGELRDAPALNEFHALIVAHGKRHCGPVPACAGCCLRELCGRGRAVADRAARTAQL